MSEQLLNILLGIVIAILTGLFLLFVEYRFKIFARQKKHLIYEVLASTPLLSVSEEVDEDTVGRLQVLFDSKPVQNVTLLTIRFSNVGNVEIRREDYDEPINIGFEAEVDMLKTNIIDKSPANLPVVIGRWTKSISIEIKQNPQLDIAISHGIEVKPILLNPGDYFTLSILASDYNGNFKVEGRIAGIREIEYRENSPYKGIIATLVEASIFAAMLAVPLPKDFFDRYQK